MVQPNRSRFLLTEEDLPDSDDTSVDNELQLLIPALLRSILAVLWADRTDWFLGVNMGIYYDPDKSAIVPDGFLSLGVPRRKRANQTEQRLADLMDRLRQQGIDPDEL